MDDGRDYPWSAIFVPPVTPLKVLRILERHARVTSDMPPTWWLSSRAAPQPWRVLVSNPLAALSPAGGDALAARLQKSLQSPVFFLRVEPGGEWEGVRFASDAAPERDRSLSPAPAWWHKLPGMPPPPLAWQIWLRTHNLPLDRMMQALNRPGLITDYRTVVGLDERGLLVERSGQWFEMTLGQV